MPITRDCQSLIYSKNNPHCTLYQVNSGFTRLMHNKTFGECLREQLESKGIRPAELARRSGVTKQNIGRLLNATPHPITGALPRAEPETVTKLAEGLEWDVDEALLAAGHAPRLP
jgi:hypothetical protein